MVIGMNLGPNPGRSLPGKRCNLRAKGSIREITGLHEACPGVGLAGEHEGNLKGTKGKESWEKYRRNAQRNRSCLLIKCQVMDEVTSEEPVRKGWIWISLLRGLKSQQLVNYLTKPNFNVDNPENIVYNNDLVSLQ
jgi:hypothetical protein